jgi:transcriptional regulator with XRE-family HTH domain
VTYSGYFTGLVHLIATRVDKMNAQRKAVMRPSMLVTNSKETVRTVESISIGSQLKAIRTSHNLTLEEAGKRTGLARSTLSKIENEQTSPTLMVMQKLAIGLNIELPQLFSTPSARQITGRRDITLRNSGEIYVTSVHEHELLATQFSHKKMTPYKSRIYARDFDDFGEWIRHEGEKFLLVLEGSIQFITEFYEAITLTKGDNVYFDANMGHLVLSVSKEDAEVLWVSESCK